MAMRFVSRLLGKLLASIIVFGEKLEFKLLLLASTAEIACERNSCLHRRTANASKCSLGWLCAIPIPQLNFLDTNNTNSKYSSLRLSSLFLDDIKIIINYYKPYNIRESKLYYKTATMVYINSRGEVVDDTRRTATNIFWRFIEFVVMFFKSLVGIEDKPNSKKDDNVGGSGPISSDFYGGGGGGGGRPGGSGSNDNKGQRKFGPRGFKSITDLSPPPTPMMGGCSGGACG